MLYDVSHESLFALHVLVSQGGIGLDVDPPKTHYTCIITWLLWVGSGAAAPRKLQAAMKEHERSLKLEMFSFHSAHMSLL